MTGFPQMGPGDPRWDGRWGKPMYPRLIPDFFVPGYGTDFEPESSYWMASLLDPLGERFSEGITLLDFGCGAARLFNFMTGHLANFRYYAAEPRDSNRYGAAERIFGADKRISYPTCERVICSTDILRADAAILGSVFTHLTAKASERILDMLSPIAANGGMIVFTAILNERELLDRPGTYALAESYEKSFQDIGWPERLRKRIGLKIDLAGTFKTPDSLTHSIFSVSR